MIRLSIATCCPDCGRDNLVKNGPDYKGAQKFRCNECGADGTLDATGRYTPERKAEILRAYQERSSMRGIQRTFSDFWSAYQNVFATGNHRSVGKASGETNHVERWNNTLRQRLARFVQKTLSFSKSNFYHELVLRLFIIRYNIECIS